MISSFLYFIFVPIFIWMLIGSYKEVKRDYDVKNDYEFLFKIFWLLMLLYSAVTFFMMAFFDTSIVFTIKRW
jgi:hypothetical protein